MAFVTAIDATTGARVAVGQDSFAAYYAISGGVPTKLGYTDRLNKLKSLFTDKGYSLVSPTAINANVEIQLSNSTYFDETQWAALNATVNSFISDYGQKYQVTDVYYWLGPGGSLNFGILVSTGGVVKLYYIIVQVR